MFKKIPHQSEHFLCDYNFKISYFKDKADCPTLLCLSDFLSFCPAGLAFAKHTRPSFKEKVLYRGMVAGIIFLFV